MKRDLVAGFSVFLLALPLSLAIALGSGAPPFSGIFAAIVGGIIGSFFGEGLTIKGPAAGMIAIVLGAIEELGGKDPILGYELMLAVGVVSAILQILIAFFKKGSLAKLMPEAVLRGMLGAIGVIIISKQIYIFCGLSPDGKTPFILFYRFFFHWEELNLKAFIIGFFSFCIAFFWPRMKNLSFIPSSIVILISVVLLSLYFKWPISDPKLFIKLPKNLLEGVHFPNFSSIFSLRSLKYIIMFSFVGSVESLLTVRGLDSMRGDLKPSDLNRDLKAIGIVNLVSSFFGGLPVISETVRSRANSDYGALSQKSNFFHGFFLLIGVVLCPQVIELIPLPSLAALLIFVGLKLIPFQEFLRVFNELKRESFVFLTTFFLCLEGDLLVGILAGFLIDYFWNLSKKVILKDAQKFQ
jgi:MFS superfamily sulfate permease-like transporter